MDFQNVSALKASFERLFPDYAAKFEAAKTQDEVLRIQDNFIAVQKENLRKALEAQTKNGNPDYTIPISLDPEELEKLINARGDEIEKQVQYLLDGLERLSGMADDNPEKVTAQLLGFGALAVSLTSGLVAFGVLNGAAIVTEGVVISASLAGVVAVGVAAVVACAAIAIALILIPFVYFMAKPAVCIMFLINELDQNLVFKGDYNRHGKTTLITEEIGKSLHMPSGNVYANGGLFSTSKCSSALIGTSYGMTMGYGDVDLNIGMGCPLASGKNNCYVMIDESSEDVAAKSDKKQLQFHETSKDGVNLSIRCNSGSGSIAWYVARAWK